MTAPLPNPCSVRRLRWAAAKAGSGAETIPPRIVSHAEPHTSRKGRSGCKSVGERGIVADMKKGVGDWGLGIGFQDQEGNGSPLILSSYPFQSLPPSPSPLKLRCLRIKRLARLHQPFDARHFIIHE